MFRLPVSGETKRETHKRESIERYGISSVDDIKSIKRGLDYITPDGIVIPNQELTTPPTPPRSYAYSSDTMPNAANAELLDGVDLLYHDATYAEAEASLAEAMCHSTARQAAEFAVMCKAKQLMLGHYSSRYKTEDRLLEEAVKVFPNTILANEGLRIEL
jgi:ribonuclease Z